MMSFSILLIDLLLLLLLFFFYLFIYEMNSNLPGCSFGINLTKC